MQDWVFRLGIGRSTTEQIGHFITGYDILTRDHGKVSYLSCLKTNSKGLLPINLYIMVTSVEEFPAWGIR